MLPHERLTLCLVDIRLRCTRCLHTAGTKSAPLSLYEQSPDHRVGKTTPLHELARVRSLLHDGADPWARGGAGLAPIDVAAQSQHAEIFAWLRAADVGPWVLPEYEGL